MRRFPFYLSFLFLLFTTSFSTSSAQVFPGCNHTFACGGVRGISYPFTGGDRPSYCGPPEFQLRCVGDWPELTMGSLSYRVLNLDDIRQSLVISRLDLWNNSCTEKFFNSTPDSDFFSFDFGNEGLTLLYGCSAIDYTPENYFICNISGTPTDSYHLIGAVPTDPIVSVTECQVRVRVPILQSSAQRLADNRSFLLEALMEGFNVNYSVPFGDQCSECLQSGGQCGFDSEFSQPMCICGDLPCPVAVAEKKNQLPLKIGMGVGGAAILCLFLGCVLYVAKRRKKHKMQGKHVSLPHFSNGVSNPNTNHSQRIPSFPYSKSDLENGSTNYGVQVFNYMELEEATKNFDPSRELGEGGFGTVYYGKLSDGREVAVKRLYENNLRRAEQFKNELEILTRLHHPNLVKLYGSTSRRSQELLLVYEYIPNGTVADHLHGKQANSEILNWHLRLRIALETADALAYLHHSDIIHRDVKTNNILLDDNFQVKVADFGLSRLFPNNVTHVSTAPQGTPGYVDPEYYQVYQLTDKSDVFSFGVVLIELISSLEAVDMSRHRRDINLSNMALNKIQRGALHELVDPNLGFETDLCVRRMIISVSELAFRCLQQDKEMRPPMDEVLEILRGIENKESGTRQAEVVDISGDDVRLMKNMPPPLSPDSLTTDKLVSTTTTDGSF